MFGGKNYLVDSFFLNNLDYKLMVFGALPAASAATLLSSGFEVLRTIMFTCYSFIATTFGLSLLAFLELNKLYCLTANVSFILF